MNRVILVGRVGSKEDLRQTKSGKDVLPFSVATDDGWGEQKRTNWHNIVLWGNSARACAEKMPVGTLVLVEGRMVQEKWEKDGQKFAAVKVHTNSVEWLKFPKRKADDQPGAQPEEDDTEPWADDEAPPF